VSNETLFYIFGIAAAVSAVVVSFLGLKVKSFPGRAMPVVVLWFALVVGGATTFAVLNAQDEEKAKAAELAEANKEAESEKAEEPGQPAQDTGELGQGAGAQAKPEAAPEGGAKGPGGTLQLAADPSQLAFDKTSLDSKPGKVTIDFDNPSPIEHDVVIEQGTKEIASSELVSEGKASVSADLAPGTYTFFCSVPGHAEAGMQGTLTVK
jgi:plastocyanin